MANEEKILRDINNTLKRLVRAVERITREEATETFISEKVDPQTGGFDPGVYLGKSHEHN